MKPKEIAKYAVDLVSRRLFAREVLSCEYVFDTFREVFQVPESDKHASVLARNQKPLQGDAGAWGEYFFTKEAPLATGEVILALLPLSQETEIRVAIERALKFLRDSQNEKTDGGWEDISQGVSIVDATGCVIAALVTSELSGLSSTPIKKIEAGVEFLIEQQNPKDGGWGVRKQAPSKMHYTYFALWGLKAALPCLPKMRRKIEKSIDKGIRWIRSNAEAHQDEGIGISIDSPANPVGTALAILSLHRLDKFEQISQNWVRFLQSQQKNGDWVSGSDESEIPEISQRRVYAFESIPWVVQALLCLNQAVSSKTIQAAIKKLGEFEIAAGGFAKEPGDKNPLVWFTALVLDMTRCAENHIQENLRFYVDSLTTERRKLQLKVQASQKDLKTDKSVITLFATLCFILVYFFSGLLRVIAPPTFSKYIVLPFNAGILGIVILSAAYWFDRRAKISDWMKLAIAILWGLNTLVLGLLLS